MKIYAPLALMVFVTSGLFSDIALSKEIPQTHSMKCQELKQRLTTIKGTVKSVNKASSRQIENYVLSGLVGTQISSQKKGTADRQLRHLSNQYAQKCSK